jgi:hypothetical protein
MHDSPKQKALYYMNEVTRVIPYFHIGDKLEGKLWSITQIKPDQIPSML